MNILTLAETLKEGQTACQVDTGREVIKIKQGSLVWKECRNTVQLTGKTLKSEFEIVPDYVSFTEAMEAVKERKTVWFHGNKTKLLKPIKVEKEDFNRNRLGVLRLGNFSLVSLIDGKWTIEEESE